MDYKNKIKSELTIDDVYSILEDFGGEPMRQGDRIISTTICHNLPQEGSRKLYYYENGEIGIFRCYTGCAEPSFDIFELIIKVMRLQHNEEWSLPQAIDYVARSINFSMWGMDFSKDSNKRSPRFPIETRTGKNHSFNCLPGLRKISDPLLWYLPFLRLPLHQIILY